MLKPLQNFNLINRKAEIQLLECKQAYPVWAEYGPLLVLGSLHYHVPALLPVNVQHVSDRPHALKKLPVNISADLYDRLYRRPDSELLIYWHYSRECSRHGHPGISNSI